MRTIFIFIIIPLKHALLTKREVHATGYMAKFLFLHFARLSRSPFFFLVGYATRLRRSFGRCGTSYIEARLRSLLRTYERSTCSKSSIVFTETKSRPMRKERRQYPAIVTEEAWSRKDLFYGHISVVLIHNGSLC